MLDTSMILLGIGLAISFFVAMALGANDAATPTDCAVGAGIISVRKAILLFAIFTGLGAGLQGHMVIKTIGKGITPSVNLIGALISSIVAGSWVIFCSWRGLDISVTYASIGSVIGYGIAEYGIEGINKNVIQNILLSWLFSPFCSMTVSYTIYKIILKILYNKAWSERIQKIFSALLIMSLCFSAYSFGANDVGNATGVYVTVAEKVGRMPDQTAMFMLAMLGAVGIAVGGFIWGKNVIETVAFRITRIDILMGFAAELGNALVVYIFTTIPYMLFGFGLPISTSVASDGSIIGVGLAKSYKSINFRTVARLVITWILTVPITAFLSGSIYLLVTNLFGKSLL
ncbi:MAG: hypothetical protein DRJ30_05035 [Candidatus Methanomethylicota archaeon]|mgnify:CR=1 FL=1|nr:MAG: hypothetical protein DRJ30_05035 [Candidatus Verstraetearchaeota archaeon]